MSRVTGLRVTSELKAQSNPPLAAFSCFEPSAFSLYNILILLEGQGVWQKEGRQTSVLKAFSLFCSLYQFNQGRHFVLGLSIETAIPF